MSVVERHISSPKALDDAIARVASGRHGVFSRDEAVRLGATSGVIRSRTSTGRWQQLHSGVYRLAGAPASWRQSLAAACLSVGRLVAASHRSAGTLWRLVHVELGELEIIVPRGVRVSRPGVRVHESRDLLQVDITIVDAIPVTTPARTLIDLAAVLGRDALEEAVDDALRRRLTSIFRLRWRIGELARNGRPGLAVIRALVDKRTGDPSVPQSVLETRLLRLIERAGLPAPVRQHRVKDRGRLVAIVDFAYPEACLAIEADGYRWHSGRAQWESDLARRNALTRIGWRVIHVTWQEVERRPHEVVAAIASALRTD